MREDGRNALTLLTPVAEFRAHTLVRAELQTGRTHQIRVHATRIGLPLVGDLKYGAQRRMPPNAGVKLSKLLREFNRQALHAYRLAFKHPRSAQSMTFELPMPRDIKVLVEALQRDVEEHD